MSICCCWLDVLFQPRSSEWATRISRGIMINAGMFLASSRRFIYHSHFNWEKFVHSHVRAIETYSEAKHHYSERNRDVLMNAQSPHKW